MGRPGRKAKGVQEDQYGESMVSQDRQMQLYSASAGRGTGGGAGGSSRRNADITFTRQVPKFLQPHAHLLGAGRNPDAHDEEGLAQHARNSMQFKDDDEFEKRDEEESLQQALLTDPSLAEQHPELLAHVAKKLKAAELKERGNAAFEAGRHEEAVQIFTDCITLDTENEIYYSNRAASYLALKQFKLGATDARRVIFLKPGWVKGWARLGFCLLGMGDAEARETLEKAVSMEPNDASLRSSLDKAIRLEAKQAESKQHVFKKRVREGVGDKVDGDATRIAKRTEPNQSRKGEVAVTQALGTKRTQLLSFEDDDTEET